MKQNAHKTAAGSMRAVRRTSGVTGVASLAALSAYGYQPSLSEYRPVVDSYNTDMAAYEIDRAQCVNVGLQAQAEYERQQQAQRESNITIGLIFGAIASAAVGLSRVMRSMSRLLAARWTRWKAGWRTLITIW